MYLKNPSTKKTYRVVRVIKGIDDAGTKSYIPSYKYKLDGNHHPEEKIEVWEHELDDLGFEFDKMKTKESEEFNKEMQKTLGKFFSI